MKKYVDTVQNQIGLPINGASVTVNLTGTSTLATLYSDDGVTTTTNPVTTDALGKFQFYVEDGRYDLVITGTNVTTQTISDVEIFDNKSRPVVMAHLQQGADFGAKLNAAIALLPSGGGVVDARGLEGAQTISSAITVDRPVVLLLGAANFTVGAGGVFNISNPNFQVIGEGRGATTFTVQNTTPFAFSGSTAVNFSFLLQGIKFTGGGGSWSNQLVSVPNQTAYQGAWTIRDCYIGDFGQTSSNAAVYFGDSNYRLDIKDCFFNNNRGGDVFVGYASDGVIDSCQFGNISTTKPHIRIVGGGDFRIEDCEFENNTSSTVADIVLDAQTTSQGGEIWITKNKFGGEGETAGTRYKIDATSATSTDYPLRDVYITENRFSGLSGSQPMKMIKVSNPPYKWIVKNNVFIYASTVIDDVFSPISVIYGQCQFVGNELVPPTLPSGQIGTILFTNDGRGFSVVRDNYGTTIDDSIANYQPRLIESYEIRNRVVNSENYGAWTANNGATVTGGQADPLGTTRASLITASGSNFCSIAQALNVTGLQTRGIVKFWAKAGTLSVVTILIQDNANTGDFGNIYTLRLTSGWRQYKLPVTFTNAAHAQNILIYPGGQNNTTAGNIVLWAVQVSDTDCDYLLTAGAATSTTAYGLRTERGIQVPHLRLEAAAQTVAAGQVSIGATTASTVGAAGGASALPATPLGYLIINVAGTQVKVPYYNN